MNEEQKAWLKQQIEHCTNALEVGTVEAYEKAVEQIATQIEVAPKS